MMENLENVGNMEEISETPLISESVHTSTNMEENVNVHSITTEQEKAIITKNTEISVDQLCILTPNSPLQPFLKHDFLPNKNGLVTPRAVINMILHIIFHF